MIQKLYSPVFCKIYAEEDYQYDTPEKLSQRGASEYIDKIQLLAYRENETLGKERGLMEYYGENDSVDKKVQSLFINFELINRELWGVTTIDVAERLNPQEMELLKDYISGQMSDGFGEGFEQREIKTEDGVLYVSLWDSGDEFHIYTAKEFSDKLGIELSEVTGELRAQLIERSEKNWEDYRHSPHNTTPDTIFNVSVEVPFAVRKSG